MRALHGADFTLLPGELHALLGENGAGKTTLMHVAYGLVRPDGGAIEIQGVRHAIESPRAARRLGLGMVHQHLTAIPALTVAENVALAAGWRVDPVALRSRVGELAQRVGLPLDPDVRSGHLAVALRQRLEIVKALASDARILILDEPTAVLAPSEADDLLRVLRAFTGRGGAAVLITHKLDEALAAADRVTVLRHGVVVMQGLVGENTPTSLATAMVGGQGGASIPAAALQHDAAILAREQGAGVVPGIEAPTRMNAGTQAQKESVGIRLEELEIPRESGLGIAVRRATLTVRPGEIVGIAAVEGNGQRELLRAVAGRLQSLRGRRDVSDPLGFVPEDRTTEGLIPELTLTENVVLASHPGDSWLRRGRIDWKAARAHTAALLEVYRVVASGPDALAASLSGGNQQKLVVARELARRPAVIVAENPTRGMDIRAAEAIRERLMAAARDGAAVLFHSSDLDEVVALAQRLFVAARGTLREVAPHATKTEIGELMASGGR
ncbi:MAG TPA: ATP-binding cassette domain-containing protein [Gemmatimonadales bacterium]|nr:ATP-binding cassette domain-containing protein [Gemmatimonadales bacterium]